MLPQEFAAQWLIVTFLPDNSEEKVYSHICDLRKAREQMTIPNKDDVIHYGGSYWKVNQVVHEWSQHEHNLCITVSRLVPGEKPPYPVHLKKGDSSDNGSPSLSIGLQSLQ